jgi:molecular chaperone GrpE
MENEQRFDVAASGVSEDELMLDQFRSWLSESRAEAATIASPHHPNAGLYDLVESFTALRQEVKLQTKSGRSLQAATGTALDSLQTAIDEFHAVKPREVEAARIASRPLLESLADLCEALDRGRTVIERTREQLLATAEQTSELIDAELARTSFWKRQACRCFAGSIKRQLAGQAQEAWRPLLDSLLEGYRLIQQRLDRAMQSHGLERIACVGLPVDVNSMTVVEVVDVTNQPAGEVVEELRPGFRWQGEVIRFAEVKAARNPGGQRR